MLDIDFIKETLNDFPLGKSDEMGVSIGEIPIQLKLVNRSGVGVWLIAEGKEIGNDYLMFGLCKIIDSELGFVSFSQLQCLDDIVIDETFKPKSLRECVLEDDMIDYDLALR